MSLWLGEEGGREGEMTLESTAQSIGESRSLGTQFSIGVKMFGIALRLPTIQAKSPKQRVGHTFRYLKPSEPTPVSYSSYNLPPRTVAHHVLIVPLPISRPPSKSSPQRLHVLQFVGLSRPPFSTRPDNLSQSPLAGCSTTTNSSRYSTQSAHASWLCAVSLGYSTHGPD
ncbi:hypothetical protein RRG08_065475 [Elysia crispata]|uniref:Uncharacterized protein n=1 Tax=Elysia crispata TaxID=231223 RepID=A0AAE1E3W7_9GAST|nr:hypothetical protein RRG08_065475 [Elysia crispata]